MSGHSKIGRACVMKNLISWLKYSAFRNPHSAIGKRGFTLIEIIVLIVMAGILIPVIVIPFATGIRKSTKPEMVTTAMYLAQQRMEELMKYNYCRAGLNPTALTALAPAPIAGYQWQWEILLVQPNATNGFSTSPTLEGYKQIRVRVSDPDADTYEIYALATFFP